MLLEPYQIKTLTNRASVLIPHKNYLYMTIAKDFASKAAIAFVALAMALSMFAPAAQAQSSEDLQKMINDLLAQIASLQSQVGQGGSSVASGVCPYTWTRDLSVGSTGADVMKLQQFLNADADTRVAAEGAGSVGMETETYGPATAAAVSKMQVKYRAEVLSPAGLVNPTGYFGAASRAKANSVCSTPVVVPGDDTDEDMTDDEDATDDEDEDMGELQGEASLESFEVEDADESDVEEGEEDAPVAEVTVEFTDGDAEISRLDLSFKDAAGTDSDAWDVFTTFSLWVDGEMIAEADASDEDDYLGDEDDGVVRFSGLDLVGMEDEEVTIVVAASINNNLESAELGDWDVKGVAVRFFDADGVATTEDGSEVTGDTATFTIEVEGAGDDLDMKSSTNDPDATTLALDEDDTSEYTVFAFELDADDSDGDVTIEGITIDLVMSSSTRNLDEVVKDVRIEIDGESFAADDFDGAATGSVAVDFDVDGDFTIDAEDAVEVAVIVEFEDMDGDSALQGVTLTASVDTTDVDAEGQSGETVTLGGSNQDGEAHTLRSEGLVLEITSITETKSTKSVSNTDLDYGTFVFKFDVTAFGEDFYMDEDADVVNFLLKVGGVSSTTGYTATVDIAGADDATTADWKISEGETAVLTLTVETNTGHDGSAEVVISSVDYSAGDDATEELNVLATPADDWTSEPLILN